MATDPAAPPVPALDGHVLLLYSSEEERQETLAAWVRRGLENNEKVICAATDAQIAQGTVLDILAAHGIDVGTAIAGDRLAMMPLQEFFRPGGLAGLVDQVLAEGFRRLRTAAEERTALTHLSAASLANAERGLDELCRSRPLSALCQYEQPAVAARRLAGLVGCHPSIRQHQVASFAVNGSLALAGEIDISNDLVVEMALAAAASGAAGTLRLDLRQVQFLGAAGLRALDAGTRRFRDDGGRVLLAEPGRQVEQILRITRMDQLKNMEIVGGQR
ncbi:MAG: MEDS domain-containing protein [Streptosporangiaceae bacterium]